ncbi:MAG: hypothetical protein Q9168_002687 [Polycauliona sp. 1 TL-2023]
MLFICLLVFAYPILATPLASGNRHIVSRSDGARAVEVSNSQDAVSGVHDTSSPSLPPPSSLSPLTSFTQPIPSTLSTRSLRSFGNITVHYTSLYLIDPTVSRLKRAGDDIAYAMDKWIKFVDELDDEAQAPDSHFTLGLGSIAVTIWSPAPVAWTVVAGVLKAISLFYFLSDGAFGRVFWFYVYATLFWITFELGLKGAMPGVGMSGGYIG